MKRNPFPLKENEDIDESSYLYGEDSNFFIDTISYLKESLNNTDKSSELINNMNSQNNLPFNKNGNKKINLEKMIYKNMNSKDKYIKSLEQKIYQQEETISKLIDYKNLCEDIIKDMNPSISFPLQKEINYNINNYNDKSFINRKNKNKKNIKKLNLSFNQNYFNDTKKINKLNSLSKLNRANSEREQNNLSGSETDKYDKLYLKYIKIINDFKNLSNNSVSTNEYTRLKTQFNELKNKNNNLIKQIQNSKKTLNIKENVIIKNLKEQLNTFREELVLSQAMVNSLRTELEHYNKNNQNIDLNYCDNENRKTIYNNYTDNNLLKEENENLKLSLKNNNILLSKILEENNKLKENKSINDNLDNQNEIMNENIFYLKNKLNQYENKFDYFNDYINSIKKKIDMIFNDINNNINNLESPEGNKKFSEDFLNKLNGIKNNIKNIKNIDRFNLDSEDDEECLKLYMKLVKLLLKELENSKTFKINNDGYQKNIFYITKNHLLEILEILKNVINENGIKQLISDTLDIIDNLGNLYKIKNNNSLNGNNNINKEILELEKELEYIKTLLLNHKKIGKNKNKTYFMNYNSPNLIANKIRNGYYFQYE